MEPPISHLVLVGGGHAHVQAKGNSNIRRDYFLLLWNASWVPRRLIFGEGSSNRPGGDLSYDVISFNVGSLSVAHHAPGVSENAIIALPIANLCSRLQDRRRVLGPNCRVVVVGGGGSGVELAFALQRRLSPCRVTLVTQSSDVVSERAWWTRHSLLSKLQQRGIDVLFERTCVSVSEDGAYLGNGKMLPADVVLWATGAAPSDLLMKLRVPLCKAGYIHVSTTLQSVVYPNVFAAGDCCTLEGYPFIEKAGVYALREGPVLAANILSFLRRESLATFSPQSFFLAFYSTADGSAVSSYMGMTFSGEWVWNWKEGIDRAYMARFDVPSLGPSRSALIPPR